MKMQDEMPSRIRFHYDIDKKARLETVHGVWGGINPHGEIEMSFYHTLDYGTDRRPGRQPGA